MLSAPLCLVALAVVLALPAMGQDPTVYVSPAGDDAWTGAQPEAAGADGPVATVARALELLRERRGEAARARIVLRGGDHWLPAPLELGPADSGTLLEAYPDETPILSGGRPVGGWRAEGDIWQAHLPEVADGGWAFTQLFIRRDGADQRRYRPTVGPLIIAGLTDAPARKGIGHRQSQDEFYYREGDIRPWHNLGDVEIVALHDWSASRLRIRELDEAQRIVRFTGFPIYRIGHWYTQGRNPYFAENVREAFDAPGEFYLDRADGTLLYRPLPGETLDDTAAIAPRLERLLTLTGEGDDPVTGVELRGLTFAHSAWTLPEQGYSSGQGMIDLPAALTARYTDGLRIEGCTFAHLGGYAIDLGAGCHDAEVIGNRLYDLGGGGIKVGVTTAGATAPVLPTGNTVANNLISDGGLLHFSAHGIWIGITDGTHVHHNLVRRFPYSNISSGWKWDPNPSSAGATLLEHNHIHDSMMLLADGGGFYSLGFQPGSILRGNYIHHVHRSPFAGRAPNNGIFFDQGSSGFHLEDNVIHDTAGQPIRYNQTSEDAMTWGTNSLEAKPGEEGFPAEIAARAGLEPAYAHLDSGAVSAPPPPIYGWQLPPPPPLDEDFEQVPLGAAPTSAHVSGEDADKGATVRITDETAASGSRSLKISDQPGMAKPFYPYVFFETNLTKGTAQVSFAARVQAGKRFWIEGRNTRQNPYVAGPSLYVEADGRLLAGGDRREIGRVPLDEWVRYAFTFPLGDAADGTWDLTVTLSDGAQQQHDDLPMVKREFDRLTWLGFMPPEDSAGVVYLDDVKAAAE